MKIFENQTKILSMIVTSNFLFNLDPSKIDEINKNNNSTHIFVNENDFKKIDDEIQIKKNNSIILPILTINSIIIYKKENEVKDIFEKFLDSVPLKDKENLSTVICHHLNNLLKSYKMNNSAPLQINLSNSTLKNFNNENLVNFLEQLGFKKKANSNNILILDTDKISNLEEFENNKSSLEE